VKDRLCCAAITRIFFAGGIAGFAAANLQVILFFLK
jgi:hypothetical protein